MGALIGAVIAGGIALYSSYQNSKSSAAAKSAAEKAAAELKSQYSDLISDVNEHYAMTDAEKKQGEADVDNYESLLRDSDFEQYVKDYYDENGLNDKYSYDKDVSDFMDPRADYLTSLAAESAQGSAAAGGMGRSYDGLTKMATAVVNKNEDLYKDALEAYNTDRAENYQEWNGYLTQKQNELSNLLSGKTNDLSNAKSLAEMYQNEQDSYWEDLMNARIAALNAGYAADSAAASTGNSTVDIGGIAQAIGAGANVGDKASSAWSN